MGSGYIDKAELQAVLQKLGGDMSEEEVAKCYAELDGNDDGRIDFEEFSRWYLKSENRIETDVQALFNKFDHDNNGHIEIDELENLVAACQGGPEKPTAEEVEKARKILDSNDDGQISKAEFMAWYKSSKFFEQQKQRRDTIVEKELEAEEEGISLAFPEGCKGRVMYLISAPIMYSLYFTLPWFFAAAASVFDDGRIEVVADSLFASILILFGMLGAVLLIIYCSKWRMTKTLGYSMFVLYLLFCVQDIARQELLGDDC